MTIYQLGSKGPEVARIQARLAERHLYSGPVDGSFGGGTQAAVREFQVSAGMDADGVVGAQTWGRLFGAEQIPPPSPPGKDLATCCVALTGAIETGAPPPDCFAGLTGDFDGQGISFGALQWCLGQGSLQPMLTRMTETARTKLDAIFGDRAGEFVAMIGADKAEQMDWARSIQSPAGVIHEPWRGCLKALGRSDEFIAIQLDTARTMFNDAMEMCRRFGLRTQRAVALMFDIRVQNYSISKTVAAQIDADAARLPAPRDEVAVLRIIANRRAEAANPRWVEDVRRRKLMIANGGGVVHGNTYDLAAQYGIGLVAVPGL